ncbi:MAG: ABC transporter permease [Ilumatobacteraceae bacterium]
MERSLRIRWWIEVILAVAALGLFVLTLISAEWIEELTGWEPDGGSGELEWLIAAVFLVAAIGFAWMGRRTHRRLVLARA